MDGLSLNAATGVISGTPTVPGSDSVSAQLAGAGPPPQTASANLSISVTSKSVTAVEHLSGKRATAVTARAKKKTVKLTPTGASKPNVTRTVTFKSTTGKKKR
jgi:hypothetical protein